MRCSRSGPQSFWAPRPPKIHRKTPFLNYLQFSSWICLLVKCLPSPVQGIFMEGEKEPDYPFPKLRQLGGAVKRKSWRNQLEKKPCSKLYIMALDSCPSHPASHLTPHNRAGKEILVLQMRQEPERWETLLIPRYNWISQHLKNSLLYKVTYNAFYYGKKGKPQKGIKMQNGNYRSACSSEMSMIPEWMFPSHFSLGLHTQWW